MKKEKIKNKLQNIDDIIIKVKNVLPNDFNKFEKLDLIKDGIYKKIEFAIQNIIDVCEIINNELNLGIPETEETIINHLRVKDIISKDMSDKLKKMKSFRNILVHRYGEIDDKISFENIKSGIKDFEMFIKEIREFLKKSK